MAGRGRGRTEQVLVGHASAGSGWDAPRQPDRLLVEEPLTIRFGDPGAVVATTMRTPGHDFELAVGWCHGEGLLSGAPVLDVRYCATASADASAYNEVTVVTGGGSSGVPAASRVGTVTSSCGWCGTVAVDDLAARLAPIAPAALPPLAVLADIPQRVRPLQELFAATGAAHAAALLGPAGDVLLVREDVGRHNALDKVIGRVVLDGLDLRGHGVFVSGRASYELVAKAWAGGVAWMVAVSAPTQLAVATAQRAGLALCGFVRADTLNVYTPPRWPTAPAAPVAHPSIEVPAP